MTCSEFHSNAGALCMACREFHSNAGALCMTYRQLVPHLQVSPNTCPMEFLCHVGFSFPRHMRSVYFLSLLSIPLALGGKVSRSKGSMEELPCASY